MAYTTEMFHSAIVAVGSFNPAIFTPGWLLKFGLIGETDADEATKSQNIVITRQIARFETNWFALQVFEEQLSLTGKGVISPALKDLAVGILQLLPHDPVTAVGLNFMGHYKLENVSDYHRFGDVFAPKPIWNDLFPGKQACGLSSLTMVIENGERGLDPENGDQKRITIQQSNLVDRCGVHLAYNDHREASTISSSAGQSSEWAADLINDQWEITWHDANRVFEGLFTQALGN